MMAHNARSPSINFWPALLDVVTAAFMVFVLSTYLQLVMDMDMTDDEAARIRALEAQFVDKLSHDLAADLTAGGVEVEQALGLVHLRFSDRVLFDSGQYELKESGKALLGRFGQFLASAWKPGVSRVQVEGHTDSVPFAPAHRGAYPTNNWELSSARATAVTLFLLGESFRLPATLISANGYGSNRPIADNLLESGRARNRRVEIELVFAGQEER